MTCSDEWSIKGYGHSRTQVLIPEQAGFYTWYDGEGKAVGVTFVIGDEAEYDLDNEKWMDFLKNLGVEPEPSETFIQRLADCCRRCGTPALEGKLMLSSDQFDSICFEA